MIIVTNETDIDLDVYRYLTKTFMLLDDCDRQFFAEHGLSARQFWALQHLMMRDGCSMVDLSRVLLTDKSNITGIVDRLERMQLVTRTPDPRDRRVFLIALTEQGREHFTQVNEQHEARIRELLGVVDREKMAILLDSLQTISRTIEGYLGQG